MGTDIHGWVQINNVKASNENYWFDLMRIRSIASRDYAVFGYLFGVRAKGHVKPIAFARGLPEDSSEQCQSDVTGPTMVYQTWLTFNEVHKQTFESILSSGAWEWGFIFETMEKLANHYGGENVRLVVGFDNYG